MTAPAAAPIAELEARALAQLPAVLRALLNNSGWPSGDAKAFNPLAKRRRWRFVVDPFSGAWEETGHKNDVQRGEGLASIVGLVTETPPSRAAEILATILARLDADPFADAVPMTSPSSLPSSTVTSGERWTGADAPYG